MTQNPKRNNQKKLFKRAAAIYTPGMSIRQLMSALQISQFTARQLLYTIRNLESTGSR
jgi:transposase